MRGLGEAKRLENKIVEVADVGREVGGISLTEAAKYLGPDLSTLSLAVKRLEEEIATDSGRQIQIERLCTRLRQARRRNYQISKA
jgi:hypothetical protein